MVEAFWGFLECMGILRLDMIWKKGMEVGVLHSLIKEGILYKIIEREGDLE